MLSANGNAGSQPQLYDYEPLDLAKQQIRLITLKPGNPGSTIQCDLEIFDVDSAPQYLALSYTWGPPSPTAHILINGKPFEIRQNLHSFLRAYRNDANNKHYIWIDQICISQGHTAERNHQVQLMSEIYKSCLWAVIWLGHEVQDLAVGFTRLNAHEKRQRFEYAKTILRHKYFGRTWVVQEMLLPPRARVFCGGIWVEFKQLIDAIHDRPYESSLALGSDGVDSNFNVVGIYKTFHSYWNSSLDLHYCVVQFTDHQCEDPRDKIYGLLGLVQEEDRLEVDYTKDTRAIFMDVASKIISSGFWNFIQDGLYRNRSNYESETLVASMGLQPYRRVITAVLTDMTRVRLTENSIINAAGFDPELERWWFLCAGTKYYRDHTNCDAKGPKAYI
jgi:hypothetical protein